MVAAICAITSQLLCECVGTNNSRLVHTQLEAVMFACQQPITAIASTPPGHPVSMFVSVFVSVSATVHTTTPPPTINNNNRKPWHPMNFRNQVRKYEAEVAAVQAAKEREQALVEWQAEQEKEATMAMLDPAEAKRQRDRCVIEVVTWDIGLMTTHGCVCCAARCVLMCLCCWLVLCGEHVHLPHCHAG